MDTNVKGVFFLTQKLLPLLRRAAARASPARVINIGSIDGLKAATFDTFSYGASKAAVHHLTRFLAAQLTDERILFNAIAPGPFPTWMLSTGVGFGGKTEDVDWDAVARAQPERPRRHARRTSPAWPSSCARAPANTSSARPSPATAASSPPPDDRLVEPFTSKDLYMNAPGEPITQVDVLDGPLRSAERPAHVRQGARPLYEHVKRFIARDVEPMTEKFERAGRGPHGATAGATRPGQLELLDAAKDKAKEEGLWNFFLPNAETGEGLSNLDYAYIAAELGKNRWLANA